MARSRKRRRLHVDREPGFSAGLERLPTARNVGALPSLSTADPVEAEEHDGQEHAGQNDDPTRGPPMSICAQCAQPTLGLGDLCAHHTTGQGADWAAGNRIMCDFLHRGIVLALPDEPADGSIEFFVDTLELALTP